MFLYEITNTVNGMGYAGITKGRIERRWSAHRKSLERNEHYNYKLQEAYNEFGVGAFKYHIRQKFSTIAEMEAAEIFTLENEKHRLYNLKKGGYDAPPVKHTEEAKRKIGESSKKPIIGMSIETGEIKEYSCGKDTALDGFNYKNIGKCCLLSVSICGKRTQQAISCGGWVWMHKSEFNVEEMERRRLMAKKRGNNDQSRAIIGKSLVDGSIIEFPSCFVAQKTIDAHSTAIRGACLFKESKSAGQHVWVFADEDQPTILLEERYLYAIATFNGTKVIGRRSNKLKKRPRKSNIYGSIKHS